MKRKRGVGRREPTKMANGAGVDKGAENFMASNAGDQSGWSDAANVPMDTRTKVGIAQANATTSRGPTEVLKNDKLIEKTSRGNSLHGNIIYKDVASFAAKPSRAVGSSTAEPCIDAAPLQEEMTNAGEQTSSRHVPLDNKKELNAALSVIKTIMKMDAAKPFNSPVDPVTLGISDYFDIIDTPMDFDTICNNIDVSFKYRSSKDIYRDVKLIWDNCSKYNKEGTKIIELMKQVKTKFLKLWSAAGLYVQRQEPSNVLSGKSLLHGAEENERHYYCTHTHPDVSMIRNSMHQGNPSLMGHEFHQPHPSCCSYEYRPPQISSKCSCSWCFRGSQPSMYHNSCHSLGGLAIENHYNQRQFETSSQYEHSHHPHYHERWWQHQPSFDQHQASLHKARMNSQNPGSSNAYYNQQKQKQMYSSHIDGYQPGLSQADDLQHYSNIQQFSCHEPGVPSTYSAGHSHMDHHVEDITRHNRVHEDLTALDPDGPSFQKHRQLVITQVYSRSRKHSPARHEEYSGSAGHLHLNPPMETVPRHTKRVQEDLTAVDPDGPGLQKHRRLVATQVNSSSSKHSPACHEENSDSTGHFNVTPAGGSSVRRVTPAGESSVRRVTPAGESSVRHVTPAGESSVRRATCQPESSVALDTNNCSSEEHQMNQNEPDSPLSDDCAMPVPEEDGHLSQPGTDEDGNLSQLGTDEDGHLSQPGSSTPEASPLGNKHTRDTPALKRKTRVRGPTRYLKFKFERERLSVTTNELGQPVGVNAPKFVRFLGTMARDGHMAPLNYIDWRAMPEVHKENMWKEVQAKFNIDPNSKYWIMTSISKKWKDWKSRLKTVRYLSCATNEERQANLDDRVLPDQWEYLVSYWNSEKAERQSAINKATGVNVQLRHAIGSKSFAQIRDEQREKRPDKTPLSRAELFIMTRKGKDGKPVNEATSAIIEKLQQNQDTSQISTVQDEVFSQIVGRRKNGQVRCIKLSSSLSDIVPKKHSEEVAKQSVLEAKAEVIEMKNKMVTMEDTCAQMASQMATMMSMMSSLQKSVSNGNVHGSAQDTAGGGLPLQQISSIPSRTQPFRKKRL